MESSVVIVATRFFQHDFELIEGLPEVSFESHDPQFLLLPKKSIEEISPPQKCMFTIRLLVAARRSKIHTMERIFFIFQSNRNLKTYVL